MKTKEEIQSKYNGLIAQMGLTEYEIARLVDHKAGIKRELDNLAVDFKKLKDEKEQSNGETTNTNH